MGNISIIQHHRGGLTFAPAGLRSTTYEESVRYALTTPRNSRARMYPITALWRMAQASSIWERAFISRLMYCAVYLYC